MVVNYYTKRVQEYSKSNLFRDKLFLILETELILLLIKYYFNSSDSIQSFHYILVALSCYFLKHFLLFLDF